MTDRNGTQRLSEIPAEKIALARSFQGMGESRRQALIDRVSDLAKNGLEFYKA